MLFIVQLECSSIAVSLVAGSFGWTISLLYLRRIIVKSLKAINSCVAIMFSINTTLALLFLHSLSVDPLGHKLGSKTSGTNLVAPDRPSNINVCKGFLSFHKVLQE